MSEIEELVLRGIGLKVLAEKVAKVQTANTEAIRAAMKPGERKVAELPDGTQVGTYTYGKPPVAARVTDRDAFLAWVKENRPDEIIVTESVRPSYEAAVLAAAKDAGAAFDPVTGEIIPGTELRTGTAALTPKVEKDAVPALIEVMRASQLLALDGE